MSAHAGLTPLSYSMQDGANLFGAYDDNAYTGTRSASGWLSGGRGDLTDGVSAVNVSAGYGAWAPYVLWYRFSPVITFDFGSAHTFSSVKTDFKFYGQAAVYMPGSMTLRYSDDGVHFGAAQLRSLSALERIGADNTDGIFELISSPASGRFVELTVNQGVENSWLALGEVSFEGVPGSLVQGQVPEPGTGALVALALVGLGSVRRSRPAFST